MTNQFKQWLARETENETTNETMIKNHSTYLTARMWVAGASDLIEPLFEKKRGLGRGAIPKRHTDWARLFCQLQKRAEADRTMLFDSAELSSNRLSIPAQ